MPELRKITLVTNKTSCNSSRTSETGATAPAHRPSLCSSSHSKHCRTQDANSASGKRTAHD